MAKGDKNKTSNEGDKDGDYSDTDSVIIQIVIGNAIRMISTVPEALIIKYARIPRFKMAYLNRATG